MIKSSSIKIGIIAIMALIFSINANAQEVNYESYFTPERLRIDLTFAGDAKSQNIFLEGLKKEAAWSGSKTNLNDTFNYGEYYLELFSTKENKRIYSKGFNTLFQEWRTIEEAKHRAKAFNSSYVVPFPKETVQLVISERVKATGKFKEIYRTDIDPTHKSINCDIENNFKTEKILYNGETQHKVDILFIAEGYTVEEMDKFRADAAKFTKYLFEIEPYKSRKADFNIWACESISKESGTDIPHQDIWKNTVASSNFYTFESDRYLTAPNHKQVAQIASNSPYDAIYVIVNTSKYGGGGIYNFYGLSMSNHPTESMVFVHEFGHSFAGLADEYYDSSTSYEDFYNLKVEPWEPNITTLVDFEKKWKDMIKPSTPKPTPNKKRFAKKVGLFEGGGYMAKGIYRPTLDCRMKTNTADGFCPICTKAINDMIDFYVK